MNRRILKKHCARAREILIAEHRYRPGDFVRADGEESIDAPRNMPARQVRPHGWLEPGPLKGTWLLWQQASVEYDEWDLKLPTDVLADINVWRFYPGPKRDREAA